MDFAEHVEKSLHGLLDLYGGNDPSHPATTATMLGESVDIAPAGQSLASRSYTQTLSDHTATVEKQVTHDDFVNRVVAGAANESLLGRKAVDDHLSVFRSRLQALSAIPHPGLRTFALMDTAQSLLSNATRQVNQDVEAVRQRAASIIAPVSPLRQVRSVRAVRKRSAGGRPVHSKAAAAGRRRVSRDGTLGSKAVEVANNWVGTPYVWGGGGPGGPTAGGFDCSGLTQYAIAQASHGQVILPRTTYEQINEGVPVHPRDVRPGDLVFPGPFSGRGPEHVQLAAGGGMVIEAPYTGSHVKWSEMPQNAIVRRVL